MFCSKMGNYINTDFYVYGRIKETDSYKLLAEIKDGNPMSRFKHEVYAYALKKRHTDIKSLYLYCGYTRVAKAIMVEVNDLLYLDVSFMAAENADEWDQCQEQIPQVYVDIKWLENSFLNSWVILSEEDKCIRKYENYKMNIKT